jgi:Flp pilus assembly protein TadG
MRKLLRRLMRNERGAVAVEMAIIGPPFLLTLLSIVELGLILTTQALLDGATRDAARLIRTGQVSAAGNTIGTFQTLLCNDMSMLLSTANCTNNVLIDVVSSPTATNFAGLTFGACGSNAGSGGPNPCPFSAGNPGDIVAVQVSYNRSFVIPWVGNLLSIASDSQKTMLQSNVVFRNEPF